MKNERELMELVTKNDPISEARERIQTLTTAIRDLQKERARAVDAMGAAQKVVHKTITDLGEGKADNEQLLQANRQALQTSAAVSEVENRMAQIRQALTAAHQALADAEQ